MKRYPRNLILFAFALALSITLGSSQLLANKPVRSGKTTVFNGVPACDCIQVTQECGCIG